jgi:hypothetical protein
VKVVDEGTRPTECDRILFPKKSWKEKVPVITAVGARLRHSKDMPEVQANRCD